jgi:hypothetical protein
LKPRFVPDIGIITAVALIIRVLTATWTGLTTDEANGVMIAVTGSWLDMLTNLRDDGNAPLFYVLVRQFSHYFGYHAFALKCLAISLATATVPITYWLFRQVLAKEYCISLAILLAFCPTMVWFGTLIRPYALEGMLGLISTFACVRVLSPKTNIFRAIVYSISTVLLMYTHFWGAFIPIGHVGLVMTGLINRWFGKKEFLHWFAGAAFALFLFLPQIISVCIVVYGLKYYMSPFDMAPRPLTLVCNYLPMLLLSKGFCDKAIVMLFMFICNFLVLLAFVSPKVMLVSNKTVSPEIVFDGRLWKAATVCGLLGAFWMDFFLPSMRYRYLLSFVPMVFVVYITSINEMFAKKSALIRLVLPCAVWIAMFLPFLITLPLMPETSAESIVVKVVDNADRKKDIVLMAWEIISPTINFYLPKDIESISYPHMERSRINRWTNMTEKLKDPAILPQLFTKLQSVLDRGGKVWFIDISHDIRPLDYRNNSLVENVPFLEATKRRSDQIRSWLVTHAREVGETQVAPGRDFSIIVSIYEPVQDPAARAALPKVESLWETVDPEAHVDVPGEEPATAGGGATNDSKPADRSGTTDSGGAAQSVGTSGGINRAQAPGAGR